MMLKRPFQIFLVALATWGAGSLFSPTLAQAGDAVAPPPLPDPGARIIVQPGEIPDCVIIDKQNRKVKLKKFKSYADCQKDHLAFRKHESGK